MRVFATNAPLAIAALLLSGVMPYAQDEKDKTSDAAYEVGDGVTAPKATYTPDPQYVEKARKEKINGSVVLSMIVTAEGKVRDVKVIKSLHPDLDNQAVVTVRTWRFEPGLKNGKAVEVRLRTEVMFRLY